MKKLLLWTMLLSLAMVFPIPTMAQVDIHVGIPLPPPIVFPAPPAVIAMPDTDDVYAVPDVDADLFFWSGWWWRPWQGRWYRSHYYDRGWGYYHGAPSFYFDVDPGWRGYYRDHNWYGHRWNYQRIPHDQLHRNWNSWHNDRHWERHGAWGVERYQPRPQQQRLELRQQREREYHQRPEVQRHQQQRQEQQKEREGQQHQKQKEPEGQQHQGKSQDQQPQGKPEGGDAGHRK